MKRYIAVIEIDDDEEIVGDANISYTYRCNGTNYGTDESVELKAEGEGQRMKTYEDGLNEAWELARNITCAPTSGGKSEKWVNDMFGYQSRSAVMRNYSASEAIARIEMYERFNVGDEVKYRSVVGVVLEFDDDSISVMRPNGRTTIIFNKQELKKTGRHFPQIEEVLKQIQEGRENGNEDN